NQTVTADQLAAGSVQHYTCPNNCEGSGGAQAGTCPVCGTAYVHNQAFHAQQSGQQTQLSNQQGKSPVFIQQPSTSGEVADPVLNSPVVAHYVCSKGCGGVGSSAGNCPKCGAALSHNPAYHNN
ncbi:MAG: hypothetical protein R3350_09080, partial [Saprospiraceae bacterium]|nr:hypothetical protein [Saprospiraceae bacterium]